MSFNSLKLSLVVLLLVVLLLVLVPWKSEAELEQWCVAAQQTSDSELLAALNWACGKGGADCSKIQIKGPCYIPNTVRDHANYALNDYYQKFKHKGASCNFNSAAVTTDFDPSHSNCHFDFLP